MYFRISGQRFTSENFIHQDGGHMAAVVYFHELPDRSAAPRGGKQQGRGPTSPGAALAPRALLANRPVRRT